MIQQQHHLALANKAEELVQAIDKMTTSNSSLTRAMVRTKAREVKELIASQRMMMVELAREKFKRMPSRNRTLPFQNFLAR